MIFSAQHFVEDRLKSSNIQDDGHYAITFVNVYFAYRDIENKERLLRRLGRIQTTAYRNSLGADRAKVERGLLEALNRKVGSVTHPPTPFVEASAKKERTKLRAAKRRSIGTILQSFARSIRGRNVDAFWASRKANILVNQPEKVAQNLLTVFIMGALSKAGGQVFRELQSGTGYVDLLVLISTTPHLIELKIQKSRLTGPKQLATYMVMEGRKTGWLIIFDARPDAKKTAIPPKVKQGDRTINVLVIDINPTAPSKKK